MRRRTLVATDQFSLELRLDLNVSETRTFFKLQTDVLSNTPRHTTPFHTSTQPRSTRALNGACTRIGVSIGTGTGRGAGACERAHTLLPFTRMWASSPFAAAANSSNARFSAFGNAGPAFFPVFQALSCTASPYFLAAFSSLAPRKRLFLQLFPIDVRHR